MDAHDGNVFYDPASKLYHWVAASYGTCKEPAGTSGCSGAAPGACGFRLDHNVSVFTSPDLATWTSHPPALEMGDSGVANTMSCVVCPRSATVFGCEGWTRFMCVVRFRTRDRTHGVPS